MKKKQKAERTRKREKNTIRIS